MPPFSQRDLSVSDFLLLAAAVPDQEVEHLAPGVVRAALRSMRKSIKCFAATHGEPEAQLAQPITGAMPGCLSAKRRRSMSEGHQLINVLVRSSLWLPSRW